MTSDQIIATSIDVNRQEGNRVRGRLFEAIEAAGLPERQENALKGVIRNVSYQHQTAVESALRGRNQGDGTRP
ncbi:MAG TPA: hypothetical protein VNS09_03775 [Solirubrobacter sp.]|nr:hypothetical protein [Solirubrobacter sp.]